MTVNLNPVIDAMIAKDDKLEEMRQIAIRYHKIATMMTNEEYVQWAKDAVVLNIAVPTTQHRKDEKQ